MAEYKEEKFQPEYVEGERKLISRRQFITLALLAIGAGIETLRGWGDLSRLIQYLASPQTSRPAGTTAPRKLYEFGYMDDGLGNWSFTNPYGETITVPSLPRTVIAPQLTRLGPRLVYLDRSDQSYLGEFMPNVWEIGPRSDEAALTGGLVLHPTVISKYLDQQLITNSTLPLNDPNRFQGILPLPVDISVLSSKKYIYIRYESWRKRATIISSPALIVDGRYTSPQDPPLDDLIASEDPNNQGALWNFYTKGWDSDEGEVIDPSSPYKYLHISASPENLDEDPLMYLAKRG